ncbi:hypothetical protein D3C87_1502070 [compost metagenome]
MIARTVEADALRTDRQGHRFAGLADIDRQRLDLFATAQLDHAALAALAEQTTVEAVVLTDEVGDESVFRFFVEGARWGDLLDFALMEYRNAVGHGQRFTLIVGHVNHGHA